MLQSRYFEISVRPDSVLVCYRRIVTDRFGRVLRPSEVRHLMKGRFEPLGGVRQPAGSGAYEIPLTRSAGIARALGELDGDLDALAERPLTPSAIKQALGITGVERTRWTKDGRLSVTGPANFFGRGRQTVRFDTYPPDAVFALMANPEIIIEWRRSDARHVAKAMSDPERNAESPSPSALGL
jgi:hypothetical protein